MPQDIPQELVERMVALTRWLSEWGNYTKDEASAIVALLPKPIDPDLERVHQIAQEHGITLTPHAAEAIASYFKGRANV